MSDDAAGAAASVGPVALAIEEALQPEIGRACGCSVSVFVVGGVCGSGGVVGRGFRLVEEFDDWDQKCVQDVAV